MKLTSVFRIIAKMCSTRAAAFFDSIGSRCLPSTSKNLVLGLGEPYTTIGYVDTNLGPAFCLHVSKMYLLVPVAMILVRSRQLAISPRRSRDILASATVLL